MTFDEYEKQAAKTAHYPTMYATAYTFNGLISEVGELAAVVKRRLRGDYNEDEAYKKLFDELGDVLWYLAMYSRELGFSLEDVAEHNLKKLADRAARGVIKGEGDNR